MPILRLILLIGVASLLLLFVLPNWEPSIQLVFLGLRSPAFPLSLWILGAVASGILTAVLISGLFQFTGFTAQRRRKPRSFEQNPSRSYSYTQSPPTKAEGSWQSTAPRSQATATKQASSDWEEDASDWFDDDSSWEDEPVDSPRDRAQPKREQTNYEAPQDSKSGSRSSSSYSYSYRDPKASTPQDPEPIVDADYRVIVPPYRNLDPNEESDEENR